jgi:hypothetical protein
MKKRRAIVGGLLTALFVGFGAWAFGFFNREDPQIAKLHEIGSQMWDRNLPEAQRNELRGQFRAGLDSMTEDQRRAFFDSNRDQWMGRMQQRMDEFFAMSRADQQKRLDEILNRMVQARNSQQQNGGDRSGRAAGNRGGGRNTSDAGREARAQRRLDRTNPKQRAQATEFRKQLEARAQQRGIQLGDQRGGGFGGFGGFPRGV